MPCIFAFGRFFLGPFDLSDKLLVAVFEQQFANDSFGAFAGLVHLTGDVEGVDIQGLRKGNREPSRDVAGLLRPINRLRCNADQFPDCLLLLDSQALPKL